MYIVWINKKKKHLHKLVLNLTLIKIVNQF